MGEHFSRLQTANREKERYKSIAMKAGEQVKGLEGEIAVLKDKLLKATYSIGDKEETIRQMSDKLAAQQEAILEKERQDAFKKLWASGAAARFTPRGIHRSRPLDSPR